MSNQAYISFQLEGSEKTYVVTVSPFLWLQTIGLFMGAVVFAIFFFLLSPLESTASISEGDPEDLLPQLQKTLHLSEILFAQQATISNRLRGQFDEHSMENNLATFSDNRLRERSVAGRLEQRLLLHRFLFASNADFAGTYQHFLGPVPRLKPIKDVTVNSPYGWRKDPFSRSTDFHGGLDLKSVNGTPVRATAAGRVRRSEFNGGGYGNLIVIEHASGYSTYYAHLSSLEVSVGDYVYAGQQIGRTGQTGRVTGPHLHYEVRYAGRHRNPQKYIPM